MTDQNRRFNLNLLRILNAMLECRNVTRAGERFNLTQPAASAALARLREAFGDELLVQVGREMKLTPKAERMRDPVKQLLALLETTMESPDVDPRTWSGEFIIATADYAAMLILPRLFQQLDAAAPKISVRITNISRTSASNLRSDDIDMIIAPPQIIDDSTLMSRRLFGDRFVCIHRRDAAPADASIETYMQRTHISTVIDAPQIGGQPKSFFSQEIDSLRCTQHNVGVLPYYTLLPMLVSGGAYTALVQERLAKLFAEYLPIEYTDPPVPLPPLELHMLWSPRFNDDPRHRWMRDTIFEVCSPYR